MRGARRDARGFTRGCSGRPSLRAGARVLLHDRRSSACSWRRWRCGRSAASSGSRARTGRSQALCHAGANLVPSGHGCEAFAETAVRSSSRMIIGEERAVDDLWAAAGGLLPLPREDRPGQPVYEISAPPPSGDTGLRRATVADLERLLPACAAAHELELGDRPAPPRRGRLPLACPQPDRGGPLVALARGRRDPVQGRGLGLDARRRADAAGVGRPRGARAGQRERVACATSAGCCSSRRRS